MENEQQLKHYLATILSTALAQYPTDYFEKIGLNQIVLCKKLSIYGQQRAAVPEPVKNTLFLGIDSIYPHVYLKHVLHHELHHLSEYAVWGNMFYDWKKWTRKNDTDFLYGKGGTTAYENLAIDWYDLKQPRQGFVNLYSTTGQEEDRCELMALLMTNEERAYLKATLKKDKLLKKKFKLLIGFLAKLSKQKRRFWKGKLLID